MRNKEESEKNMGNSNYEDCIYSDIVDWEQNKETGKAKAIYWCEKYKKLCNDIRECQYGECGFYDK